ncbi:unnamed protein product [Heterosigma akashiwo]
MLRQCTKCETAKKCAGPGFQVNRECNMQCFAACARILKTLTDLL